MRRPLSSISPRLAWSLSNAWPSVVLPEPLSPTTPTVCPSRTVTLTPSTALTSPVMRRKRPPRTGNRTSMSRAVTSTGACTCDGATGSPRGSEARRCRSLRMAGRAEDLVHPARLHDLALGHHPHAVGHAADDAEVVSDEEERHAEPLLERLQQAQDLRLDGDVERGGGLVRDQQLGLIGQRHGDHHALPLAPGELVRIGAEPQLRAPSPTRRRSSSTRARAAARFIALCTMRASATCFSIVWSGFSEVMGSWNTIAMRLPRMVSRMRSGARSSSMP